MGRIDWIQLSDLHFGYSDFAVARFRERFPKYTQGFFEKMKIQNKFLFITGDIRYAKSETAEKDYQEAVAFVQELMEMPNLGVDKDHIYVVPGNHDVTNDDSRICEITRLIEEKKYISRRGWIDEKTLELLKPTELFCNFHKSVTGRAFITNHVLASFDDINILSLDTSITCRGSSKDYRKLFLGTWLVLQALKDVAKNKKTIVLAHHGFEWFTPDEQSSLEALLKDYNAFLYLYGHSHEEHSSKLQTHIRPETEMTCFCCPTHMDENESGEQATSMGFLTGTYDTVTERGSVVFHKWDIKYSDFKSYWEISFGPKTGQGIVEKQLKDMRDFSMNYVKQSLMIPWMSDKSISFLGFYEEKQFIFPQITSPDKTSTLSIDLVQLQEKVHEEGKICVLGDAGAGKSTLLRYLFIKSTEKGERPVFVTASDLVLKKQVFFELLNDIISGSLVPPDDFILFIDGLDEGYANDHSGLNDLLLNLKELDCKVLVSCRSSFYREMVDGNSFTRLKLEPWKLEQAECFVKQYYHNNEEKFTSAMKIMKSEGMSDFIKSPLMISILLFLLDSDEQLNIESINEYYIYEQFYLNWILHERKRGTSKLSSDQIFKEHIKIAEDIYKTAITKTEVTDSAVTGLLNMQQFDSNHKIIRSFYHRTFLEFILARHIIETIKEGSDPLYKCLETLYRDDVNDFVKAYLRNCRNKYDIAMMFIKAYTDFEQSDDDNKSPKVVYSIKSQIVYYLSRLEYKSDEVSLFIRKVYQCENEPKIKQCIAYAAAILGVWNIALEFARALKPGSIEDITNRSWTVVYYGDVPDEDAYSYIDENHCSWKKSRAARQRRLQSSRAKDKAFRMFDLQILYSFFENRGWHSVNQEEYNIIKDCIVDIVGYPVNVIAFLKESKNRLLTKYKEQLHIYTDIPLSHINTADSIE